MCSPSPFLKTDTKQRLAAAIREADVNKYTYKRIASEYWLYEGHSGNAFPAKTRTIYPPY